MMIPTEAREELYLLRQAMTERAFCNEMWRRRNADQPKARRPSTGWPYVRLCDQPVAEARVNVHKLPTKLRSAK